jgi:hypothetical protein
VRDAGERPVRLLGLMGEAEAALEAAPAAEGWQVVTFAWLRSRTLREGRGAWAGRMDRSRGISRADARDGVRGAAAQRGSVFDSR